MLTKAEIREIIYCLRISGTTTNPPFDQSWREGIIKKLESMNTRTRINGGDTTGE